MWQPFKGPVCTRVCTKNEHEDFSTDAKIQSGLILNNKAED